MTTKKIVITTLISTLAGVILVPIIAYIALSIYIYNYNSASNVYIHSPDGKYTLIVKEKSYLMGGGVAEIYGVEGSSPSWIEELLAPKLGETFADDGIIVFNDERGYRIEWLEDEIVIRYYSGRGAQSYDIPASWDVETIEYPDNTPIYLKCTAIVAPIVVIAVITFFIVGAVRKRKKKAAET